MTTPLPPRPTSPTAGQTTPSGENRIPAFSAYLTQDTKTYFRIKFDQVVTNVQGGYDPNDGKFSPPVSTVWNERILFRHFIVSWPTLKKRLIKEV